MVVEEPEYTLWGWILLSMFGVTPKPDHIVYRCQICRQSLGTTRDPRVLARRTDPKQRGSSLAPKEPRKDLAPPADGSGDSASDAASGSAKEKTST